MFELLNNLILKDNEVFVSSIQNSERFYKEIYTQNINPYLDINDRTKVVYIFKIRTDLLLLNGTRFSGQDQLLCTLCNRKEIEDIEHFIAKCPILSEIRTFYFEKSNLNHNEFLNILNGVNDTNWNKLYLYVKEALDYRKEFI